MHIIHRHKWHHTLRSNNPLLVHSLKCVLKQDTLKHSLDNHTRVSSEGKAINTPKKYKLCNTTNKVFYVHPSWMDNLKTAWSPVTSVQMSSARLSCEFSPSPSPLASPPCPISHSFSSLYAIKTLEVKRANAFEHVTSACCYSIITYDFLSCRACFSSLGMPVKLRVAARDLSSSCAVRALRTC